MTVNAIKSITPVQRGNHWVARIRLQDGTEHLRGEGAGYTLHQCQMLCDSLRRDIAHHGAEAALAE